MLRGVTFIFIFTGMTCGCSTHPTVYITLLDGFVWFLEYPHGRFIRMHWKNLVF